MEAVMCPGSGEPMHKEDGVLRCAACGGQVTAGFMGRAEPHYVTHDPRYLRMLKEEPK